MQTRLQVIAAAAMALVAACGGNKHDAAGADAGDAAGRDAGCGFGCCSDSECPSPQAPNCLGAMSSSVGIPGTSSCACYNQMGPRGYPYACKPPTVCVGNPDPTCSCEHPEYRRCYFYGPCAPPNTKCGCQDDSECPAGMTCVPPGQAWDEVPSHCDCAIGTKYCNLGCIPVGSRCDAPNDCDGGMSDGGCQ